MERLKLGTEERREKEREEGMEERTARRGGTKEQIGEGGEAIREERREIPKCYEKFG